MNVFDNWLRTMANNTKTCDTVISESAKKIKMRRLGKLSEDEQGMIKYRRLIDKWVNKEQDEDYVETDDDGNETLREPGEVYYTLKGFKLFEIVHTDYDLSFNGNLIHPEKIVSGMSIKNELMNADAWRSSCIKSKFTNMTYAIGKMIEQLFYGDDEDASGVDKMENILNKLFEMMKNYDISGIEKFIKQKGIEVDDKTGGLNIPSDAMDTIFSLNITPNELSV